MTVELLKLALDEMKFLVKQSPKIKCHYDDFLVKLKVFVCVGYNDFLNKFGTLNYKQMKDELIIINQFRDNFDPYLKDDETIKNLKNSCG